MLSGIEDASWKRLSLRVLMHEMPSVSRMREIRTSDLMREEGLTKQSLLYSTVRIFYTRGFLQKLDWWRLLWRLLFTEKSPSGH